MKRYFDIVISLILFLALFFPMILISLAIALTSRGPILYWSDRIGKNSVIFKMPKFRTMKVNAPNLPTHLMMSPNDYLNPLGGFLRRYSLDELPQLFSIFLGDMSFVGPRPALFNQEDLISLRKNHNIDSLLPGLTGWAQVNGRDQLSIIEKVNLDIEYMNNQSLALDLKIFWMTFIKVIRSKNISH
tara:strand:- start:3774 stop:4334 length:561 start_codon:yes stop_codon:yes gene_type:complete